MKKMFSMLFGLVLSFGLMAGALAQTYPYTNPSYLPNAVFPQFAIVSAVSASPMTLSGVGTVSLQITGTCTNLAGAALQASNDGTNYVTLNMYPNQATAAASAVTSATATGMWTANVAGFSKVRLTNTAVTGSACMASMVGNPNSFSLPR